MALMPDRHPVYIELGSKRVFAGAIDWPGWCRSDRDESLALEALLGYGARYAAAMTAVAVMVVLPAGPDEIVVTERLPGDATTDFGAPGAIPSADQRPIGDDYGHLANLLQAAWLAFGRAVAAAEGHELRKGPRGGGRDLSAIVRHVVDANRSYLGRVAWKSAPTPEGTMRGQLAMQLSEALGALARAADGAQPSAGPRGGKLWPPRYFVRRVVWHLFDHAWEIEDRVI
jgi:hypothetical protein